MAGSRRRGDLLERLALLVDFQTVPDGAGCSGGGSDRAKGGRTAVCRWAATSGRGEVRSGARRSLCVFDQCLGLVALGSRRPRFG